MAGATRFSILRFSSSYIDGNYLGFTIMSREHRHSTRMPVFEESRAATLVVSRQKIPVEVLDISAAGLLRKAQGTPLSEGWLNCQTCPTQ